MHLPIEAMQVSSQAATWGAHSCWRQICWADMIAMNKRMATSFFIDGLQFIDMIWIIISKPSHRLIEYTLN
jgi:hypothetical protein